MSLHDHRTIPAISACSMCNPPEPTGTYLDTRDQVKVAAAVQGMTQNHPELVEQAGGDARFAVYMALVDHYVQRACGLSYRDLPDYPFRVAYEAGETAREVTDELLEEYGYDE